MGRLYVSFHHRIFQRELNILKPIFQWLKNRFRFWTDIQTTHAANSDIHRCDGHIVLRSRWGEGTLVNGQAIIGSDSSTIRSDKLLVVNGSLKAWDTEFLDLEVSGSVQMLNCTVRGSAELFGKVRVDGCVLHRLDLYGTVFHFQDTQINGPLRVRSPFKVRPKIVLENSTIKGEVVFEEGVGGVIDVRT